MSRFARDVLLKAKWGDNSLEKISIEYIDRGGIEGLSIIKLSEYSLLGRSFINFSDETMLPYHRITRIFEDGNPIWIREEERSKGQ